MIDLNTQWTQAEFGKLVGISTSAVSHLVAKGIIDKHGTAGEWLLSYTSSLRASAAGRSTTSGGEDLTLERALQVKVARMRDEIKLEVDRNTFVSVEVLESALIAVCAQVATTLQPLHLTLRKYCPALTDNDEVIIQREIARAMEACEAAGLELAHPGEEEVAEEVEE